MIKDSPDETSGLQGMLPDAAAALVWARMRAFADAEGHVGVAELFERFDADGSGTLDFREFKAALAEAGLPGASNKVVETVMKAAAQAEGARGSKKALDYASFVQALVPAGAPELSPTGVEVAPAGTPLSVAPSEKQIASLGADAAAPFVSAPEISALAAFAQPPPSLPPVPPPPYAVIAAADEAKARAEAAAEVEAAMTAAEAAEAEAAAIEAQREARQLVLQAAAEAEVLAAMAAAVGSPTKHAAPPPHLFPSAPTVPATAAAEGKASSEPKKAAEDFAAQSKLATTPAAGMPPAEPTPFVASAAAPATGSTAAAEAAAARLAAAADSFAAAAAAALRDRAGERAGERAGWDGPSLELAGKLAVRSVRLSPVIFCWPCDSNSILRITLAYQRQVRAKRLAEYERSEQLRQEAKRTNRTNPSNRDTGSGSGLGSGLGEAAAAPKEPRAQKDQVCTH
jgi:hypothetical protein